jgi:hypothetical protein
MIKVAVNTRFYEQEFLTPPLNPYFSKEEINS